MGNTVKNGQKWSQTVTSGQYGHKRSIWSKTVKNGQSWSKTVNKGQNGQNSKKN